MEIDGGSNAATLPAAVLLSRTTTTALGDHMRERLDSSADELDREIARVWALVDKDGSGSLDASELAVLLSRLSGRDLAAPHVGFSGAGVPPEVAVMMSTLDKNGDGLVSFEELRGCLRLWLADAGISSTVREGAQGMPAPGDGQLTRQRSDIAAAVAAGADDAAPSKGGRSAIHKHVASFFRSFTRESVSESVCASIHAEMRDGEDASAAADGPNAFLEGRSGLFARLSVVPEVSRGGRMPPADRLKLLGEADAALAALPAVVTTLMTPGTVAAWCAAVQTVLVILRISDVFDSASLRPAVRDLLLAAYVRVCESGVMDRILRLLHPRAALEAGIVSMEPRLVLPALGEDAADDVAAGVKRRADDEEGDLDAVLRKRVAAASAYGATSAVATGVAGVPMLTASTDAAAWAQLQCLCLTAWMYYVRGPRLPFTPAASPWHPKNVKGLGKMQLARGDGVASALLWLFDLLMSPFVDVRRRSAALLAAVGAHHEEFWQLLVGPGAAVSRVLPLCMDASQPAAVLDACMALLAVCCGATHAPSIVDTSVLVQYLGGGQLLSALQLNSTRRNPSHAGSADAEFARVSCIVALSRVLPFVDVVADWAQVQSMVHHLVATAAAAFNDYARTAAAAPAMLNSPARVSVVPGQEPLLESHASSFLVCCAAMRALRVVLLGCSGKHVVRDVARPDGNMDAGAYIVTESGALTLAATFLRDRSLCTAGLGFINTVVDASYGQMLVLCQTVFVGMASAMQGTVNMREKSAHALRTLLRAECGVHVAPFLIQGKLVDALTASLFATTQADEVLAESYAETSRSAHFPMMHDALECIVLLLRLVQARLPAHPASATAAELLGLASDLQTVASQFPISVVHALQAAFSAVYEDKQRCLPMHAQAAVASPTLVEALRIATSPADVLRLVLSSTPASVDTRRVDVEQSARDLFALMKLLHERALDTARRVGSNDPASFTLLQQLGKLDAEVGTANRLLEHAIVTMLRGHAPAHWTLQTMSTSAANATFAMLQLPSISVGVVPVVFKAAPGHASAGAAQVSNAYIPRSLSWEHVRQMAREAFSSPAAEVAALTCANGVPQVMHINAPAPLEVAHRERDAQGAMSLLLVVFAPNLGVPTLSPSASVVNRAEDLFLYLVPASSTTGPALLSMQLTGLSTVPFASAVSDIVAKYGVASTIDPAMMKQLYDVFATKLVLSNGSSRELSFAEFRDVLLTQGMPDTEALPALFKAIDSDGSGSVSFEELVVGLAVYMKGNPLLRIELVFKAFDADRSGTINRVELTNLVYAATHFDTITVASVVDQVMATFDTDRNGVLSFDEFKQAVLVHEKLLAALWR